MREISRKKVVRKIKDVVLIALSVIAVMYVMILSTARDETVHMIHYVYGVVAMIWLILMGMANGWFHHDVTGKYWYTDED